MSLLGTRWMPETADRWTIHDVVAAFLSPLVFVLVTIGGVRAAFGDAGGWWLLAAALGASLLLWAIVDRKLKAQSLAFARREAEHETDVEERQRWKG